MFKIIKKILIGIFISSFFITSLAYGKSCKFLFWSPIEFLRQDPNINMTVTEDTFSLDEVITHNGQRYFFGVKAGFEKNNTLTLALKIREKEARSNHRGFLFFDAIMEAFGDRVKQIQAFWCSGDNLNRFNQLTRLGFDYYEAAAGTWTGQNVARYGFTGQPLVDPIGKPGQYDLVTALFRKPDR